MLSIIVRCFNVAYCIDDCIINIVNQKYQDIEIICINDASTDDTLNKLKAWHLKDSRIKIINFEENHGISFGLNVGIKESKGQYITIIDGDDYLINNQYFSESLKFLDSDSDIEITVCKSVLWDNPKNLSLSKFSNSNPQCVKLNENEFILHQHDAKQYLICSNSPNTLWCNIYRRALLDRISVNFPSRDEYPWSAEDALWVKVLYAYAKKIKLIDVFAYLYNWHPGSFSRLNNRPLLSKFNKNKYGFIEDWWTSQIRDFYTNGILEEIGSPLIKWLMAAYPSTLFGNKRWVEFNILSKYKIDLNKDDYFCTPRKYSKWSKYDEWCMQDFHMAMANEGTLTSVKILLTNACSLKCSKCSNLCQYIHEPHEQDIETVCQEIDELMSILPDETLFHLKLLGGEPFLYSQLIRVLSHACKYSEKYHDLTIFTNGTIVPNQAVIHAIKDAKAVVNISDYGEISSKRYELCKILEELQIPYTISKPMWFDVHRPRKCVSQSTEAISKTFRTCQDSKNICPQISDGRYYQCTFLSSATFANLIEDNADNYVILKNAKYQDIKNINTRTKPFDGCKYCNGCNLNVTVPIAEQTKVVLDFPLKCE